MSGRGRERREREREREGKERMKERKLSYNSMIFTVVVWSFHLQFLVSVTSNRSSVFGPPGAALLDTPLTGAPPPATEE